MRLLITAAILSLCAFQAQAANRHHRHHGYSHRHVQSHHVHHRGVAQAASHSGGWGMVTVSSAAGPITVASHLAGRFQALIADFVAAGYKPRAVGCAAHGGHVPNSRHYHGAACDFDQRGWGKTTSFMYHAREIIARHGFRDGCSFNDCGHVDDGQSTRSVNYAHRSTRSRHYAHRSNHSRRYAHQSWGDSDS